MGWHAVRGMSAWTWGIGDNGEQVDVQHMNAKKKEGEKKGQVWWSRTATNQGCCCVPGDRSAATVSDRKDRTDRADEQMHRCTY